jgi:hypothetical protein
VVSRIENVYRKVCQQRAHVMPDTGPSRFGPAISDKQREHSVVDLDLEPEVASLGKYDAVAVSRPAT